MCRALDPEIFAPCLAARVWGFYVNHMDPKILNPELNLIWGLGFRAKT